MPSRVSFDVAIGRNARSKSTEAGVLRVLVIADLSGDARTREVSPLSGARTRRVDLESFGPLLKELAPRISLESDSSPPETLTFRSLDDFHPDQLFDTQPSIAALRETRSRLLDPSTFADERARLLAGSPEPRAATAAREPAEDDRSLLGRLLGATTLPARPVAAPPRADAAFDALIRRLVAPYVNAVSVPEQTALVASVDAAIGAELRRILHAPAFQRLEATWRGLDWLLRDNPLDDALALHVLDARRDELLDDIRASAGDLTRSSLHRLIVRELPQAGDPTPLTLVIGDLWFSGAESDVPLLAGLGALSGEAGGVFLGGASPQLWGAHDLVNGAHRSAWSTPDAMVEERMGRLRESAVAPFIGLLAPRILGRVAYGKRSDPIARCAFEELSEAPDHESFLWLHPAFGCAQLIARGFAQDPGAPARHLPHELGDLPMAVVQTGTAQELKPCAEVHLDEASAELMLRHGVTPWISHRNSNRARLLRLQSLAHPPQALALGR